VAARLAGLQCWVLRVLDQEGVVVPVRTDSNRRLYSDNDIALLARVRYLMESPPKGRGVNIAGIKVILEMEREHQQQAHQLADSEGAVMALTRVNSSLSVVETK
jgi:MerR family glutamine synthetase transcriptional repressor